jgi:glutaredoxin
MNRMRTANRPAATPLPRPPLRGHRLRSLLATGLGLLAPCLGLLAVGPALAQYKVVGPDGSVTYTDRPPITSNAKVTPLNRRGEAPVAAADASLPFELRSVVARYPVTLYVSADCPPCDSGRQFLQQRGVPFTEQRVGTEAEAAALEKAAGARTVPALTIGSQALRGLSLPEWTAFLDLAGYPKEARGPRPAPVVRAAAAPAAAASTPGAPSAPARPELQAPPVPASGNTLRF